MMDRKYKRTFTLPPPAAHPPSAPSAARFWLVLDMRLRMRDGSASGGPRQGQYALQESPLAPVRRLYRGIVSLHALLTWYRREHAAQAAVQRHTAPRPHQGDPRQGHQGGQRLHECHWRQDDPSRVV